MSRADTWEVKSCRRCCSSPTTSTRPAGRMIMCSVSSTRWQRSCHYRAFQRLIRHLLSGFPGLWRLSVPGGDQPSVPRFHADNLSEFLLRHSLFVCRTRGQVRHGPGFVEHPARPRARDPVVQPVEGVVRPANHQHLGRPPLRDGKPLCQGICWGISVIKVPFCPPELW